MKKVALLLRLAFAIGVMVMVFSLMRDNKIFAIVEQNYGSDRVVAVDKSKPKFIGGEAAQRKYFTSKWSYDSIDDDSKASGRIMLKILVSENGETENVEVLRGIHPQYDAEAMRIAKEVKEWVPAERDSVKIAAYAYVPLYFK